jgi:hypothetical protein
MSIGDEVEVTGRPYGDCPALGYQIDGCPPLGTRLTIVKLHREPDGAELSDGFQYPAASFKLANETEEEELVRDCYEQRIEDAQKAGNPWC